MNLREVINKPIVITGIMGSGKTTVGKRLAKRLNLQFYDSDKVVESREGLSVVDIHDFRGAEYFQQQEVKVITEIMSYGALILSTGGSSFIHGELRELMKKHALTIWLSASLEVLYDRVSRRNTRPELNVQNKREVLQKMLDDSNQLSADADIVVESFEQDSHYIVDTIISKLKKHFGIVF